MKQLMHVAAIMPNFCRCFDFCAGQPNPQAKASCYGELGQKENYCDKLIEHGIEKHLKQSPPTHPDVMDDHSEYYDDYYADFYDIPFEELNLDDAGILEKLMTRLEHYSGRKAREAAEQRQADLASGQPLEPEEFRQQLMDKYKLEFIEACRQIRQGR